MATWAQLRLLYVQGVGESPGAKEEAWTHLSNAYRDIATDPRVNVPELNAIDTSVSITADTDVVTVATIDFSVFAILDGFNVTDGVPIRPEPAGMIGRNRFLETTGKPPSGNVTHYMRDGSSIYVRNMPSVATTLKFRIMRQVADVTAADVNSSPLTPSQYDMAIVQSAISNYYALHPREAIATEGDRTVMLSQKSRQEVERILDQRRQPMAEEDRSRVGTTMLRGYSFSPRSRR